MLVQLLHVAAGDQGLHVGVAGHDQVVLVAAAGGEPGDGVGVVAHVGDVDGAVVGLLKVGDHLVGDVLLPHVDVQLGAGGLLAGRGLGGGGLPGGGLGGGLVAAAAGGQGQSHGQGQDQCKKPFHLSASL